MEEILQAPVSTNRFIIDGSIQRFEFCTELFWKTLKRILSDLGKETTYPKDILREAYQGFIIDDEDAWILILNDSNQTSHTYDETLADIIFQRLPQHLAIMKSTYSKIHAKYFSSL